jgi:hypothetical protein
MSILNSIRFLFMSEKARGSYVKRQVENIISDQDLLAIEGDFEYTVEGFVLRSLNTGRCYEWAKIDEIIAYKVDLITTDDLRLDISFTEVELTISEDIPGWSLFIDKLIAVLPEISRDWEEKIIEKPFAANRTIIYKRKQANT